MASLKNSCYGGDLIVDFPRKRLSGRGVHFSSTSYVTLIAHPSQEEIKNKWYSREERALFGPMMMCDKLRMLRLLASTPSEEITGEELYESVGLENTLSDSVMQHMRNNRRRHARLIIAEQRRLVCDAENLSCVSRLSSLWARERAQKLADGYWNLSNRV